MEGEKEVAEYPRHFVETMLFDSDLDCFDRVSAAKICDILQCGATAHASLLGVGMRDLMKDGHSWMISGMSICFLRPAKAREAVTLETWPSGVRRRVVCTRDYIIRNAEGKVLVKATSDWIYVDVVNRKICMLTPTLATLAPAWAPRVDIEPAGRAPEKEGEPFKTKVLIRRADTDINRHVNNVHYVEWLFEALPDEIYSRDLKRLDITYRQEAVRGEVLESTAWLCQEGSKTVHSLNRESDGVALATAVCTWG